MGHWTLDLTINPKKSKKNQNKITFIYAPYYTIMELLHWTLDLTINTKKSKKKIKMKSPLSMHHTTQLWNFFIGHWTRRSTKKNQKKNQNKITFIYAPYYTIMELLHWTLDLTINPKKSKKIEEKI